MMDCRILKATDLEFVICKKINIHTLPCLLRFIMVFEILTQDWNQNKIYHNELTFKGLVVGMTIQELIFNSLI